MFIVVSATKTQQRQEVNSKIIVASAFVVTDRSSHYQPLLVLCCCVALVTSVCWNQINLIDASHTNTKHPAIPIEFYSLRWLRLNKQHW